MMKKFIKIQQLLKSSKVEKFKSSQRLTFTRPSNNDFQRYFEINSDPNTNLYNPHGSMSSEYAELSFKLILTHWDEFNFGVWTIRKKESPEQIIGFGGLSYRSYINVTRLNLGYHLATEYWGKGYATELAKKAIQFGFKKLNANEIFALVRPKNLASIRVLEKCKMDVFGTLDDVPNEEESIIFRIEKTKTNV